jgi:hypothetical protein
VADNCQISSQSSLLIFFLVVPKLERFDGWLVGWLVGWFDRIYFGGTFSPHVPPLWKEKWSEITARPSRLGQQYYSIENERKNEQEEIEGTWIPVGLVV